MRKIIHFLTGVNRFKKRNIEMFAKNIKNKTILEIGSGKPTNKGYIYSVKEFFDESNDFIQSDINGSYGHNALNVINMDHIDKFDVILCLNVLEHIFDYNEAINNIHHAIKPNGAVIFLIPVFYPLHDEPVDYWRFTEHSLRKLLHNFNIYEFKVNGIRRYPFSYWIEATKNKGGGE